MDFNFDAKKRVHPNTIKWAQDNDIEIEIGNRIVEVWHRCDSVNDGMSIICHNTDEIDVALRVLDHEYRGVSLSVDKDPHWRN